VILNQSFTNATVLSYHQDTYSSKRYTIPDPDYPKILVFGCFSDGMGKMLVTRKKRLPTQKITGGIIEL
jgi:hypothetical protein